MKTVPAPLENKIALITGGSRGIGAALVRKFAQHGCSHIAITYHNNADLARQVLASAQEIAPRITTCAFAADLSDPEFGPKVIKEALMALGVTRLDIVIANAAPNAHDKLVPVEEMGKKNWDYHITGGAWSALSLAKAAIGHMPPRDNGVGGGGRIVFVSAVASKIAFGDPTIAYSAAKAAMDSVSKNLANVWGTRYGVTVNTISVGGTMTDGLREGELVFD